MSNILNNNLFLLEKHHPYVYQKLTAYLQGSYEPINKAVNRILLARHGELVINMLVCCSNNEYLICDHENPINESYAWIDRFADPSSKADIVFGMGFGFHLEVLLTSFKNKRVIVIEPNIELFYQVLQVRNMAMVIEKSELFVDEPVDSVLQRLHSLLWDTAQGGIQCQPFEVYAEMFPHEWDELRSKFVKNAQSFNVDIATRRTFGDLWIYNDIKNARILGSSANAHGLAGKFKGVPGILVSAGPSLAKNVHLLKGLEDKCIIMAAGTAVNKLEDHGITPHFMMGVDAGENEARIHGRVKSKDIFFLYSNQISPGSLHAYNGPKFFMNYPVDMYTAEFLKRENIESEFFISGPSVANTCFDALLRMGCNPIILVGQDLAFTHGSNYAGEAPGAVLKKLDNPEESNYILVKDIYGNDIYTQDSYLSMRNWFENYFDKVGQYVEIINATEGGLNIENASNEKLMDVLGRFEFKPVDIKSSINDIYNEAKFPAEINHMLKSYNDFILAEIDELEHHSKQQLKLVDLLKRGIYHPAKDKKAFERTVAKISRFSDRVMESPIYTSVLINMISIDFYMIKMEVDRATQELNSYDQVKDIYIDAVIQQNRMLKEKLTKVKEWITEN